MYHSETVCLLDYLYFFLTESYLFRFLSGVFADSESDEEHERPKFSGRKRQKDYFAPVNFVSGGIKIGDKVTKEEADDAITVSNANTMLSLLFLLILLLSVIVVGCSLLLLVVVVVVVCCYCCLLLFLCCTLLYWLFSVVISCCCFVLSASIVVISCCCCHHSLGQK